MFIYVDGFQVLEDLDDSCIIDKILSFDDSNEDKVTKFKQMLKNERWI